MRQLAEGLHALHETGKASSRHKAVKRPGNKRRPRGDSGFRSRGGGERRRNSDSFTLAGTPDYMSPEQGAQLPISRASDWYSVGVILYQSLTGRLPFAGKFFEVMMNKQNFDPPAPAELVRSVPQDLNDLCVALLQRDPAAADGREILAALGQGRLGPCCRR